jgi:bifunctional N-acetylglucosamine-1-phosphate-uridyltransferase/glucosamine-1-phosphate-acetyltransferase GlmU-like protein
MPPEHSAEGDYEETYTLDDVYDVFEQIPAPIYTTSDVVDALGCSRHSALNKLNELHEQGRLNRAKMAGRTIFWPPGDSMDIDLDALADVVLTQLSTEIGQPLILGGHTVYKDGDRHAVESSDDSA